VELPVPVPEKTAEEKAQEEKEKIDKIEPKKPPPITFSKCWEAWSQSSFVDAYNCPQCKKPTRVVKTVKFESFPETLMVHMRRFVFSEWVPKKLSIEVDVDKDLNLTHLQGKGIQANEKPLPGSATAVRPVANQSMVEQLVAMGFTKNASERAVLAVSNSAVDPAMNWLLQHLEDQNINDPVDAPPAKEEDTFDPKAVSSLTQLGFTEAQAKYALKQTNSSVDRAVDWLFR